MFTFRPKQIIPSSESFQSHLYYIHISVRMCPSTYYIFFLAFIDFFFEKRLTDGFIYRRRCIDVFAERTVLRQMTAYKIIIYFMLSAIFLFAFSPYGAYSICSYREKSLRFLSSPFLLIWILLCYMKFIGCSKYNKFLCGDFSIHFRIVRFIIARIGRIY